MLKRLSIVCMVIAVLFCGVSWFSVFVSPAVEKIELSEVEKTITINTTFKLEVVVTPSKAKIYDSQSTWASSNPSVAVVDGYGKVDAVGVGECVVSVSYKTTKLTCSVKVEPVYVTQINLIYAYTKIHPAETMQITANVFPNYATFKDVTYSSSNTQVATVNQTGLVTGVAEGKTTITVNGANNISNSFELEVKNVIEVEKIDLYITGDASKVAFSTSSKQITAKIRPANADNTALAWTSSNPEIISVTTDGYFKTIVHGQSTITVTANNGVTKSISLNVPKVEAEFCTIKNSSGKSITEQRLTVGSTFALKLDIFALKSVGYNSLTSVDASTREVEWTSSNPAKVSVDENGVLTAHETTLTQYGINFPVTITAKIKGVSKNVYDTLQVYVS